MLLAAGCGFLGGDDGDPARDSAAAFLDAWSQDDQQRMQQLVAEPQPDVARDLDFLMGDVPVEQSTFDLIDVVESDAGTGASKTATFTAHVVLPVGTWVYEGALPLIEQGDEWRVMWGPAAVHQDLEPGQQLQLDLTWPERGTILAADGSPLVAPLDLVEIGIEPQRMTDQRAVEAALTSTLGIDPEDVRTALNAPGVEPHHFVPVVDVRRERYDEIRPVVYPVPGLVFRAHQARGAVTRELGQHTVGSMGTITAEQLEQLGGPYDGNDVVGRSGLERLLEGELAGRPTASVQIVDAQGSPPKTLQTFPGDPAETVQTTIDLAVQRAAEAALADVTHPAALVAVDPTGAVLAAVSRPDGEFNRAIAGSYPPGSTFKIVTTDALLSSGVTPDSPVRCDPTANVGGKDFRNFEGEAAGPISFGEAFEISCNTAFVT